MKLGCALALVLHRADLLALASCRDSLDCNNAGSCIAGQCACDPTWRGETCLELNLLPAQSSNNGFHAVDEYGFQQNTWGGSIIEAPDGAYHMYASLFVNATLQEWKNTSVVVHAIADSAQGPYNLKETIFAPRVGTKFWDALDCHNPTVQKIGEEYVIFYIGVGIPGEASRKEDLHMVIGAAFSDSLDGPWTRLDVPLLEPTEAWECGGMEPPACGVSNPAVLLQEDGSVLLFYRGNQDRGIGLASAPAWRGPYTKLNNASSIISGDVVVGLEDMYVWRNPAAAERPGCHMILHQERAGTENLGAHVFTSDPFCIDGWQMASPRPSRAYGPEFAWDNGSISTFTSRERPQVLLDDAGAPAYLSSSIVTSGWTGPSFTLVSPLNTTGWPQRVV